MTGANKGIGSEIARQLAQAGVDVIIGARAAGRAAAAVEDLAAQGLTAHSLSIDLNDHASIVAAARIMETRDGRIDIPVDNAGIVDAADGPPSTLSAEAAPGHNGHTTHEESARLAVQYALLAEGDAVCGQFGEASGATPW